MDSPLQNKPELDTGVSLTLYGRSGPQPIALEDLARCQPADDELLWIDLNQPSQAQVDAVWEALDLSADSRPARPLGTYPGLWKYRDHFSARVVSVSVGEELAFNGTVLTLVAGNNVVVTHHEDQIPFLAELKAREDEALADVGCLGEASFVATLLDWHLSTYFAAGAAFEIEIERLETRVLSDQPPGRSALPQLRQLRKAASRLRRMLAPHRVVFDGLSRPDFVPDGEEQVFRHLRDLDERYERAMDVVENARELVVGSFQLFSTQTELQTNERMKLLTFVTVVTGLLAVVAGALGMNFDANFFASKTVGFWTAVAVMVAMALVAVALGKRRNWF